MRKHLLSIMAALALCLTLFPAPEADAALLSDGNYVIISVSVGGEVHLQASSDCTLFVALYSKSGKMREVRTQDVRGCPYYRVGEKDSYSVAFDNAIALEDYAQAFLLDSATFAPLCRSRASDPYDDFPAEQHAIIESVSFDVPRASLRFADGNIQTVALGDSGDDFTEDNFSVRDIVRYSVENGVYKLYAIANDVNRFYACDNFAIQNGEMLHQTGSDIYSELIYNSNMYLNSVFADSETRFVVQNGDMWKTYIGIENVPDVGSYAANAYIYHRAGRAKLVFVYTND